MGRPFDPRLIRLAQVTAWAFLGIWLARWVGHNLAADWYAYYSAWEGGLYDQAWNTGPWAYVYSPAFAQVLWPLTALPRDAFVALWTGGLILGLVYLVGPVWTALLMAASFVPGVYSVWFNVVSGNIAIYLAVVMVAGLRHPAAWAFVLLTKVTPGVGVLWFAARREWRLLGVAIGVTIAISLVSFAIEPDLWFQWGAVLAAGASAPTLHPEIPGIIVRGPLAAGLVLLAGWRSWRWLLPVAVLLALPQLGISSLVLLLAIPRLLRKAPRPEVQPEIA